ncbi:MAG: hypothetical protein KJZ86_23155 [Caldilineaceae bacterium]|nr:hypothetical protein [Caldilineaceae bacterium]
MQSEIPLPAPRLADSPAAMDLRVCWGHPQRKPMPAPPAGEILAQLLLPNGQGYTLVDTGRGFVLHFHHTGEFCIDYDLASVRVQLAPDIDPELAGLLLTGNIMACLFTLGGEPVLHASAVTVNGRGSEALAFLGASGMGKSSLAALLCANGAGFITDDLLRLRPTGEGGWGCYPGSGHLRLRRNAAASLAAHFDVDLQAVTADQRTAVWFDGDAGPLAPMPRLGAIVIPRLSPQSPVLELTRIPPAKALLCLMAFPRIQESHRKDHRQRQIDFLGRIAGDVPLYEAVIPYGLPYPEGLAGELVDGVGLTGAK